MCFQPKIRCCLINRWVLGVDEIWQQPQPVVYPWLSMGLFLWSKMLTWDWGDCLWEPLCRKKKKGFGRFLWKNSFDCRSWLLVVWHNGEEILPNHGLPFALVAPVIQFNFIGCFPFTNLDFPSPLWVAVSTLVTLFPSSHLWTIGWIPGTLLSFVHFLFQNLINNHMMVSKLAIRPISPFLQRPGSQLFLVLLEGLIPSLLFPPLLGGGYVSKNEMPSQFEKMVQWAFHFSNSPPPPPPSFFRATWKIPTKFHGIKGNTNWSMSLHSIKLLAEGFIVHTYVWLHCLMKCCLGLFWHRQFWNVVHPCRLFT
jgi:hypothetical protein